MRAAISCALLALSLPALTHAQPASTDKPQSTEPAADGGGAVHSATPVPTAAQPPAANTRSAAAGSTGDQTVAPVAPPGAAQRRSAAAGSTVGQAVAPVAPPGAAQRRSAAAGSTVGQAVAPVAPPGAAQRRSAAADSTGDQTVAPAAHSAAAQSGGNATAPPGGPAVAPTAPSALQAASACGAAQFADEVIMGVARTNLCPKPVDPTLELLSAKLERAPSKSTPVFFEVLRELRDHMHSPRGQMEQAAERPPEQRSAPHARNEEPAEPTREQQTAASGRERHAAARARQSSVAAREVQPAAAGPGQPGAAPIRDAQAAAAGREAQAAAATSEQHAAAPARDQRAAMLARQAVRTWRDAHATGAGRQQHAAAQAGQTAGAAGEAHGREQHEAAAGPGGQGAAPAAADSGAQPAMNDWRIALAASIDEAFAQAKAEQHPRAGFAAVRGVAADLDPDACLFMTGDAGQPEYACYILKGMQQPLTAASMQVYELASFEDAYLAHRALAIAYSALVKLDLRDLDIAIKRLKQAEQRWESLRKRGYLQYPWELALSSVIASYRDYQACFALDAFCTGEEGLDPERTRLIALHPGVGMGFSGFGRHPKPSADAALALSLELIGLTRYADDFETYFGVSLGAVVNDGDFRDVRPGVFVHLTRWLHVGYLMSLFRNATRYDATLFISSDLGTAFGASFLDR